MSSADKYVPKAWSAGTVHRSPNANNDWYAAVSDDSKGDAQHHPRAAEVYGTTKEEAATKALLTAAAPDMLEALRMVLRALDKFNNRKDGAEDDLLYHLSNTLPDTIAKATGVSNV